ncbi:MAG: hypothetical protein J7L15_01170, partial [Clostridiales bacterium]|nr:hypothetical protein [Clostridiales bacterium]
MYKGLIKRMNKGSDESKLEAKKEHDSIIRRLSSVEKAKVETYSYSGNVNEYKDGKKTGKTYFGRKGIRTSQIVINGQNHSGYI